MADFRKRIVGHGSKPASQFQANPLNWRKHPQRQRDAVRASLDELGWVDVVIENVRTGNLVDGHERVWQALENDDDVPYIQVDLSEPEEKLALAILDPLTNLATTDAEVLNALLGETHPDSEVLAQLLAEVADAAYLYVGFDQMEDKSGDEDEDYMGKSVVRVEVMNAMAKQDVVSAISELVEQNPDWEATVVS